MFWTSSVSTSSHPSFIFFSSRGRHTRFDCDWSSDVCSSDLAAHWLCLVFIHQLMDRRDIGRPRMPCSPGLDEKAHEGFFAPGVEGLAAKEGIDAQGPANHLTFFHRKIDFSATGITQNREI